MLKKVITALTFITVSSSAMAGLVYSIEGTQEITLKRLSNKRFEKVSVSVNATERLTLGKKVLGENAITVPDNGSFYSIEATGKNVVRIIDASENINQEVEAQIESNILGKVKTIKISGATTEALYAKAYERTGLSALKKLRVGAIAKADLQNSDLECVSVGDLLKCTQDSSLTFEFTGN